MIIYGGAKFHVHCVKKNCAPPLPLSLHLAKGTKTMAYFACGRFCHLICLTFWMCIISRDRCLTDGFAWVHEWAMPNLFHLLEDFSRFAFSLFHVGRFTNINLNLCPRCLSPQGIVQSLIYSTANEEVLACCTKVLEIHTW